MALVIDNRANSGGSLTSPVTVSSFTVNATSPLLVVIVGHNASGVTWKGSENFTKIGDVVGGGAQGECELWALKNPTTGTSNIVATYSAAPSNGTYVAVIGTTGGDTTTGWRTVYTRTDTDGTGPGLTVTDSVNGDIIVHAVNVFSGSITWDGGETTTNTTVNNLFGSSISGGLSTKGATGANTVVGATDVSIYGEIATAVMPAAGGGNDLSVGPSQIGEPVVGGSTF
jgi:hypothetical protein